MSNEIRIKDLNGFLRTAAEQVNVGKDKKLTTDAEISAFMAPFALKISASTRLSFNTANTPYFNVLPVMPSYSLIASLFIA